MTNESQEAHQPGLAAEWDPRSEAVLADQISAFDQMRSRCPVARSQYGYASVFRHADVLRALLDHETFSSAVSRRPSVPNGMDPPEHTEFRRIIDPYFSPARMAEVEPHCRRIASEIIARVPDATETEWMEDVAQDFALRVQCAFLGWPATLHEPLRQWTRKNHRATLARDEAAMAAVALEFDGYIKDLLALRRAAGSGAPDDATTRLLGETMNGRALTEDEIVSILRNWTVGELATISASVGILTQYLATHEPLQQTLRAQPELLPAAIDEILRIHPPLIMNRRVATRDVDIGGVPIAQGERLALLWASANRDAAVFGDPDEFRLDRDPALNLLYGAGIHVCPGAPLARLELRVIMEELLKSTRGIALGAGTQAVKAFFPASGYSCLPIVIQR